MIYNNLNEGKAIAIKINAGVIVQISSMIDNTWVLIII